MAANYEVSNILGAKLEQLYRRAFRPKPRGIPRFSKDLVWVQRFLLELSIHLDNQEKKE